MLKRRKLKKIEKPIFLNCFVDFRSFKSNICSKKRIFSKNIGNNILKITTLLGIFIENTVGISSPNYLRGRAFNQRNHQSTLFQTIFYRFVGILCRVVIQSIVNIWLIISSVFYGIVIHIKIHKQIRLIC